MNVVFPSLLVRPSPFRGKRWGMVSFCKDLGTHKYGCLFASIPHPLAKQIQDWVIEEIPDFHLAKGGRELDVHITVKYGFRNSDEETVQELKSLLTRYGPISVRLGGLSLFEGNEDGDVLYVEINSPQLHELNSIISNTFPCVDTHPEYTPHLTLAYLDPEVSQSYLSLVPPFLNQEVVIGEVVWSGADGERESIPLSFLPSFGVKGRWVTIPANGPGGGGSPVYIDEGGEIEKGPEGTVGKKPDELGSKKPEDKKPKKPVVKPSEREEGKKPEAKIPEREESSEEEKPVTFTSRKDSGLAAMMAKDTHGKWAEKLTKEQKNSIDVYTGESYKGINKQLRSGVLGEYNSKITASMDSAIDSAPPFPYRAKMYRGVGPGLIDKLNEGDVFEDKAFVSTSINKSAADEFADDSMIEIIIPKGTKAISVDAIKEGTAYYITENEYILSRNSKFRVIKKKRDKSGKNIIQAELLP